MPSKKPTSDDSPRLQKMVPAHIEKLLGEPPLLMFESRDDYNILFSELIAHFVPTSVLDFMLVRDIADAQWEIRRLKSMNRAQIEINLPAAASRMMGQEIESMMQAASYSSEAIVTPVLRKASRGDVKSQKLFDSIASAACVSHEALLLTAFSMGLETLSKINDAICRKERRCDELIRQAEQRNKTYAAMFLKSSGTTGATTGVPPFDTIEILTSEDDE